MADYYIETTGTGTGTGSALDPWTMQQFIDSKETTLSAYDRVYIGSGTHAVTSTWSLTIDSVRYIGNEYSRPIIQWQNTLGTFVSKSANDNRFFSDIVFDCNGFQSTGSSANYVWFSEEHTHRCKFISTGSDIPQFNSNATFYECEWVGGSRVHGGEQVRCSFTGMTGASGAVYSSNCYNCVLFNNVVGLATASGSEIFYDCVSYGNTSSDLRFYSSSIHCNHANLVFGKMDYQYRRNQFLVDCLYQTDSTTGDPFGSNVNPTILTADPFQDAANGDFRLTGLAKQQPYSETLKRTILNVQSVPGIITDDFGITQSRYFPRVRG